tara:strand:+ start:171 stop:383 length:213 start_codon:yes stop_codon:yes gene_type:complete
MAEETQKTLVEQLEDQRDQLASQIRSGETQVNSLKEQYLKVLGALEFASIQKQQEELNNTSSAESEVVNP